MVLLLISGLSLLAVWTWWTFYIAARAPQASVSLLLRVQQGEQYLDPFLRQVLQIFRRTARIKLGNIWILSKDEGEQALRIIQRLDRECPLFRFRPQLEPEQLDLTELRGQTLLYLDLTHGQSPLAALRAVQQWLSHGPTLPGTLALPLGD